MFKRFLPRFLFEIDPQAKLSWERRKGLLLRNIFNRASSNRINKLETRNQSKETPVESILEELNNI